MWTARAARVGADSDRHGAVAFREPTGRRAADADRGIRGLSREDGSGDERRTELAELPEHSAGRDDAQQLRGFFQRRSGRRDELDGRARSKRVSARSAWKWPRHHRRQHQRDADRNGGSGHRRPVLHYRRHRHGVVPERDDRFAGRIAPVPRTARLAGWVRRRSRRRAGSCRGLPALIATVSLIAPALQGQSPGGDDADVIRAIRTESVERSDAMTIVRWLSDVYGPRVTGTPAIEAAGAWAADRMRSWGLEVHEERFAYGRGWSLDRFHAHMTEPQVMPIIGYPRAWTSSTDGTVAAEAVRVDLDSRAGRGRARGTLRGKVVLLQPEREVSMLEGDIVLRMDDDLLARASRPGREEALSSGGSGPRHDPALHAYLIEEGVVAVLDRGSDAAHLVGGGPLGGDLAWPTQRTDGGTIFVGPGGSREANAPPVVPTATIAVEHYNRMARLIEMGIPVTVELNITTRFHDETRPNGFNLIGEIRGSDLADQVVILGAHFDSTHAATGATDNAAGVAAMMEAARILQAIGARPRRTIRIALWGGEEEGLLGSRAYVDRHYGGGNAGPRRPRHSELSAYYNLDNGAGRIRGIWLQGHDDAAPIFRDWMRDLADLGVTTVGRRSTRGTDHLPFDRAGLPGFQFIQDRLEYNSRTHHSNMDVTDRVQPDDLRQMAEVAAVFAYRTAMAEDRLPRR
ncbi:MAG: M20/M25/M40 family metallo-hydrolase [Acidobacteria bacterium]|nr:M20/M25/M40 family metallo-hydrolase [Acidobacteriota bacterium]